MQTILGAGGQIADELARALRRTTDEPIRLVSRKPRAVHDDDELVAADLMDAAATAAAVAGSDVVYLTVGLPADTALWQARFPTMMANTIAACIANGARLVYFDNTYMYPQTAEPQDEHTRFEPNGGKGLVRASIVTDLQRAMDAGQIEAAICRAPEFYGPGKTQGITMSAFFDRIRAGKRPLVPVSAHTRRSLIWTPDASRAMALIGTTPDAFGQTWHLPVDPAGTTYADLAQLASETTGRRIRYTTVPAWVVRLGARFNPSVREVSELLPRYLHDNIFDSSKFAARFPDFHVTSYRDGVTQILRPM